MLSVLEWAPCVGGLITTAVIVVCAVLKSFVATAKALGAVSRLIIGCVAICRSDSSNLSEVVKHLSRMFKA